MYIYTTSLTLYVCTYSIYIYIQCKDITCLLFIADVFFCETVTFIFDITVYFFFWG